MAEELAKDGVELTEDGRSERLSSETRAEVAREFRKTLNRKRPSRKTLQSLVCPLQPTAIRCIFN